MNVIKKKTLAVKHKSIPWFTQSPFGLCLSKKKITLGLKYQSLSIFLNVVFRITIQNAFVFTSDVPSIFYVIIASISPSKMLTRIWYVIIEA